MTPSTEFDDLEDTQPHLMTGAQDIRRFALLAVDMQRAFMPPWWSRSTRTCCRLIPQFRKAGAVVYSILMFLGEGEEELEAMKASGFRRKATDITVIKNDFSGFSDGRVLLPGDSIQKPTGLLLGDDMRARGITDAVVIGEEPDVCVRHTLWGGLERGFNMHAAKDMMSREEDSLYKTMEFRGVHVANGRDILPLVREWRIG